MTRQDKAPNFFVIKDTREQEGYYFSEYGNCLGMVEHKLDTGDYAIQGLEDKVCVERKGCIEELAINLGQKKHAFLNEIDRMNDFPHKFLILEFNLSDLVDFPENSRIPEKNKAKLKITGKYMSEYAKTGKFWGFPFSCSAEFLPCFSAGRIVSPPGGGGFWPKYLP